MNAAANQLTEIANQLNEIYDRTDDSLEILNKSFVSFWEGNFPGHGFKILFRKDRPSLQERVEMYHRGEEERALFVDVIGQLGVESVKVPVGFFEKIAESEDDEHLMFDKLLDDVELAVDRLRQRTLS